MTEIDRIEYAAVQGKIRQLEEKITDWERQEATIKHLLGVLQKALAEAVKREKEIQIKHGLSAGKGAP